jgi:hypothetical protein
VGKEKPIRQLQQTPDGGTKTTTATTSNIVDGKIKVFIQLGSDFVEE